MLCTWQINLTLPHLPTGFYYERVFCVKYGGTCKHYCRWYWTVRYRYSREIRGWKMLACSFSALINDAYIPLTSHEWSVIMTTHNHKRRWWPEWRHVSSHPPHIFPHRHGGNDLLHRLLLLLFLIAVQPCLPLKDLSCEQKHKNKSGLLTVPRN